MTGLSLTLVIADYDHTRDLVSGTVKPQGVNLTSLIFDVEENFSLRQRYFCQAMAVYNA
ncbi:MAG: hypothetical protein HON14_10385 [Rhodospirillaceae bacterium]|jgi:hypothetical protein|nr:hypothetical protein [Rhodospirillaceae bacterium]MBT4939529.1 hypothetical protein [Rhodospirillaceae bacterium]MBT7267792.1 hypothetical protein [Rhodospirillaceae bacterium]